MRERADAMLVGDGPVAYLLRKEIADFAIRQRLRAIVVSRTHLTGGALMSYGPDLSDNFRNAAIYVAKILNGTKPADLPVERPTKVKLIINLKTAKALGLTIPQASAAATRGRRNSIVAKRVITHEANRMMPAPHADYPCRPLLIVEPFGQGGGPDLLARALAGPLAQRWRQPVDVRNVTGEGATAAPRYVASAPADGYMLLINTSAQAYSAVTGRALSYDPLQDFVAVLPLTSQPYVVVTSVSTGIQSLGQLIAHARAKPNEATYGSTGIGTGTHIGLAKLNRMCAISARHVPPHPTDSNADAVANAIAGRFTYCMLPIGLALPAIRDDQLVALGVTTVRRSSLLPHVNTIAEAGIAGFDFPIWYGLWVRAGTPADVIEKIAHDMASALRGAELRSWIGEHGGEPIDMPRNEFARFVVAQSTLAKDILTAQ